MPLQVRLRDWTGDYRDEAKFSEGYLDQLTLPGEVSAMAFEPGLGLLAVGTAAGSVHVYGSPPVRVQFMLRPAQRVKHLVFKSDTYLLVCVDEKDNISVYDLSRRDPQNAAMREATAFANVRRGMSGGAVNRSTQVADAPMRVGTHSVRNNVLCTEVSPSHNHLFLGLADGTVDTYDLERFSTSPYRIPNLWWQEEEVLRRSGDPDAPSRLHVPLIIDMQTHPRDINVLLMCYEGGAALYSLKDRSVLRTFQLRLLPGAPGPCADAPFESIWSERLCPATAVAWHPDGEVFVMGHDNGCISFWSVKQEDKPLLVRTLDEVDVDRPVAPEELERQAPMSAGPREPIFKLAWSGFPAGTWLDYSGMWGGAEQHQQPAPAPAPESDASTPTDTILTVMGGAPYVRGAGAALHCLHLPAHAASTGLWSSTTPEALARERALLRESVMAKSVSVYRTSSTVDDFLLAPKLSPHCGNVWDPYALVVLVGSDESLPPMASHTTRRGLEAYSFPPRAGSAHVYSPLYMPLPLSFTGRGTVLGARFETVPLGTYRKLVSARREAHKGTGSIDPDKFMGGYAKPTIVGGTIAHAEGIARRQRPRILVTWHLDGSVRMHDVSPHLLLLGPRDDEYGALLTQPFPAPLPELTVSLRELAAQPEAASVPALAHMRRSPTQLLITDVHVGWEATDLAVQLATGHVLHFGYAYATGPPRASAPGLDASMAAAFGELDVRSPPGGGTMWQDEQEMSSLEGTADPSTTGFKPNVVLRSLPGGSGCVALSDIGLLAMGAGPQLLVVDCHSQDPVLRAGFGAQDFYSHQIGDKESKLVAAEANSEIVSLTFSVCRIAEDNTLSPRLLVTRANGVVTVWTMERSMDSWLAFRTCTTRVKFAGRVLSTSVLDASGNPAEATSAEMQRVEVEQNNMDRGVTRDLALDFHVLLVVSQRLVVLRDRVTGTRVGVAELPDEALTAHIVERNGCKVLAVVSQSSIFLLSLPRLDNTLRLQRHAPSGNEVVASVPQVSIELQGDFVEVADGGQLRLWTMFGTQPHGERPSMCLYTPRALPVAPGSGATGMITSIAGWLGTKAASSISYGAQLDAVLAGPRRPPAPQLPPRAEPEPEIVVAPKEPEPTTLAPPPPPEPARRSPTWYESYQKSAASVSDAARRQGLFNLQLLHKRDEMLASIDNGMASLERSTRDFVRSTRDAAIKAAAKDKLDQYL